MLPDREETGKDVQCCFCDLSITRCFLTLQGDGQGSALDPRREKSLIFKCGFSFSEGISLDSNTAPLTSPTSLPRWDLWHQLGFGANAHEERTRGCSLWLWNALVGQHSLVPGRQAGDSSHQRHCKSSAKPWPQEILIARNKSLFHLMGQSFPMV